MKCNTLYHNDCWNYNNGCAIYGCGTELKNRVIEAIPVAQPPPSALPFERLALFPILFGLCGVFLIVGMIVASVELVKPDETVVVTSPTGEFQVWSSPGMYLINPMSKITRYKKSAGAWFSTPVMFKDAISADISGVVYYRIIDESRQIWVYESQVALEETIKTEARSIIRSIASSMTAMESCGDGRDEFVRARSSMYHLLGVHIESVAVRNIVYESTFAQVLFKRAESESRNKRQLEVGK